MKMYVCAHVCVYRCACTVALADVRGKNKKAEVSILELIYDAQSDDPVTPRTLCSTTAPRCHIIHQGHHKYGERGCHTTKKFSGSYPVQGHLERMGEEVATILVLFTSVRIIGLWVTEAKWWLHAASHSAKKEAQYMVAALAQKATYLYLGILLQPSHWVAWKATSFEWWPELESLLH